MRAKRKHNVVLIADDDLFIRKIIKNGLSGLTDVIEVDDGKDVEKAYINHEPDIVFLDIHLPHKSGIDIIASLKAIDADAHIIMLSADSTAENVSTAIHRGAQGFLTKPFPHGRLLDYFHKCPTIAFRD